MNINLRRGLAMLQDEFKGIRENNPTVKGVHEAVMNDEKAQRLGQALQGNTNIQEIAMFISLLTEEGDFNSLLKFISTSSSLKRISLAGKGGLSSVAVVRKFLKAIEVNPSIQEVTFFEIALPVDTWSSLLRTTKTLKCFGWHDCKVDRSIGYSREAIISALCCNTSLETLWLSCLDGEFIENLLPRLSGHSSLNRLCLRSSAKSTNTISISLKNFLINTKTLDHLELEYFQFDEAIFLPITEGIQANAKITNLTVTRCQFDETSTKILENLMQSSCISSLSVGIGMKFSKAPIAGVLANILRATTCLTELRVDNRLQALSYTHDYDKINSTTRCDLLAAIYENCSLESFEIRGGHANEYENAIEYCCKRNRGINHLLTHPASIPSNSLPQLCAKELECSLGANAIFQNLLAFEG